MKTEFIEKTYENNNNIIENKELIQATITIKNSGNATAKDVAYEIILKDNNNITASSTSVNPLKDNIGSLNTGDFAKIDFYFTVGCGFTDTLLPIEINLLEKTGNYGGTFPLNLKITPLDPCIDSPILTAKVEYAGNNNTIGAEEKAKIKVSITNSGTKTAYSIGSKISCKNNKDIIISNKEGTISSLSPGKTEEIEFIIEAKDIIKDGTAKFDFTFTEKNGYELSPAICSINTRKKGLPKLKYVRTIIKEGQYAHTKNNSIENGEDIQATIIIKNTGSGNAENIQYEILINDTIIKPFNYKLEGVVNIPAGDSTEINFAFNVGY